MTANTALSTDSNGATRRRIRVLQVVGSMAMGGGVEAWLMHVLRNLDRQAFEMDVAVHTPNECAYDNEVQALGSRLIRCTHPNNPLFYRRRCAEVLRQYGPYDIVHHQAFHFSGDIMFQEARKAGVPVCIVHSHADAGPGTRTRARKVYAWLTRYLLNRLATTRVAVSREAGEYLFRGIPSWRTLYCGVALEPFRTDCTVDLRRHLGIPADAFVVGHVGRFTAQKNHPFVVDIASALVAADPNVRIILIGDGPERPATEARVRNLGLTGNVLFLGTRSDLPDLLRCMDVLLLPSLYEGLPLVLLEAQAAGLPCVCSSVVSPESDVVPSLVHRVSLAESPVMWADTVRQARTREAISRRDALAVLETSPFNIANAIRNIERLYVDELQRLGSASTVRVLPEPIPAPRPVRS